jgi:hypothetical protein
MARTVADLDPNTFEARVKSRLRCGSPIRPNASGLTIRQTRMADRLCRQPSRISMPICAGNGLMARPQAGVPSTARCCGVPVNAHRLALSCALAQRAPDAARASSLPRARRGDDGAGCADAGRVTASPHRQLLAGYHPAYVPPSSSGSVVGRWIVTLPGIKTGRILARMDPREVAQYQTLPVFPLLGGYSLAPVALV